MVRGQSRKTVGDKGDDLTQMATYPPSLTWGQVITFFVGEDNEQSISTN